MCVFFFIQFWKKTRISLLLFCKRVRTRMHIHATSILFVVFLQNDSYLANNQNHNTYPNEMITNCWMFVIFDGKLCSTQNHLTHRRFEWIDNSGRAWAHTLHSVTFKLMTINFNSTNNVQKSHIFLYDLYCIYICTRTHIHRYRVEDKIMQRYRTSEQVWAIHGNRSFGTVHRKVFAHTSESHFSL